MENYEKGETIEKDIDHSLLFLKCGADLSGNVLTITVRGGSIIQTLLDVALQGMHVRPADLLCSVVIVCAVIYIATDRIEL